MKQEKLVEMIRVNIKDLDINNSLNIPITQKEILDKLKLSAIEEDQLKYKNAVANNKRYNKLRIKVRESEIIRIVQNVIQNGTENSNSEEVQYPFIKDLVLLKIGHSANDYCDFAYMKRKRDIGIITINGIRYKNLICSASNVRCQKVLFIRERLYGMVNRILLCGIPKDYPHPVFAKFNSYYGLPSTDSIPVSLPNIVVIDDYANNITEIFDVVEGNVTKEDKRPCGKKMKPKLVGKGKYKVIPDQKKPVEIKPFDGAGLIDVSKMEEWKKELGLSYLPAAVQFRAIPGIKGNLYTFNLRAYAGRLKAEDKPTTITDCWGRVWDFEADHINCIITKSQFKFAGVYGELAAESGNSNNGFQIWIDGFLRECEGYQRTFNLSDISEPYEALKHECLTSYQPLQTLDFTNDEIQRLCYKTVEKVKKLHTNIDEFLNYRGLADDDQTIGDRTPPFYVALKNNHALSQDTYIKGKIVEDIKSLKHRCYSGKLFITGNYQTLTPDVFGLVQAAFGQEVTGLLKAGEVYSNYWNNQYQKVYTEDNRKWYKKGVDEIDIIRFPHIACEHFPVTLANLNVEDKEWYKYQDTGIVTNIFDSLAMRLNSADFDGDHIMNTSSSEIISAAKRQKIKTIDWVRLDDGKQHSGVPINYLPKIIKTNALGMKNSIGDVVNKISVLWSMPQTKEVQDAIKVMSIIGSLTIDYAKTGEAAEIPYDIKMLVNKVKKPEWMKYLHKSDIQKDNVISSIGNTFGISKENVQDKRSFENRQCTMQRISGYMFKEINNLEIQFDDAVDNHDGSKKKFVFTDLLKSKVNTHNKTYEKIKNKLMELQADYGVISNEVFYDPDIDHKEQKEYVNFKYRFFYNCCRMELLLVANETKQVKNVLDYIITIYYSEKEFINKDKSILWNAFSKEMINRSTGIETDNVFNLEKLQLKANKSKKKLDKLKAKSFIVSLKVLESKFAIKFNMTQEQIKYYKTLVGEDDDALRLLLILVGIYCKYEHNPFSYDGFKKNSINQSQIAKMCRFSNNGRQFKQSLKILENKALLSVNVSRSLSHPKISISDSIDVPDYINDPKNKEAGFSDLNQFAQYIDDYLRGKLKKTA